MFVFLQEISERLYNRGQTVEKNVKTASNSFYDSYLDMLEEFLKHTAQKANIELSTRMTCGDMLHNATVQQYWLGSLKLEEYFYGKLCDYTLKINAHKHKNEKNVQIDTVVNYLRVFYHALKAYATRYGLNLQDFNPQEIIDIFGITEKENVALKKEVSKLKEELASSVQQGKLKESDIETYKNLLSQTQIDKMSLEDQNGELQKQISVLKDIKLSSMEEKLNKTIELLLELKPAIVENRAITRSIGSRIGKLINGDGDVDAWIAEEEKRGENKNG